MPSFWDFFKRKAPLTASAVADVTAGSVQTTSPQELSERMLDDLALAEAIYTNDPPWLYEETPKLQPTGVGALIASEIGRAVTIEARIRVFHNEIIDSIIQLYIMPNLRQEIEKGWALGGVIFKPYYTNATFTFNDDGSVDNINGNLKVMFCYPSQFLIDDYDNSGAILKIRFFSVVAKDGKYYTKVEEQYYDEDEQTLEITNTVYETQSMPTKYRWDDLGVITVPLTYIPRWSKIQPRIKFNNVAGCLIGFYKPAVANNTNVNSPYGMSPLVRAQSALRRVDRTMNGLDWELDASLARVYIDERAISPAQEAAPSKASKTFIKVVGGEKDKFYDKYSPEIRDRSYLNILNAHYRTAEDMIGLAHGTLSNETVVARTATEITKIRQRTYSTLHDNQKAIETAIRQFVYACQVWLDPTIVHEELDQEYYFDDSVVANPAEQVTLYLMLQQAGNIPSYRTNMMYFNMDEEEAKKLADEGWQEKFGEMVDMGDVDTEELQSLDPFIRSRVHEDAATRTKTRVDTGRGAKIDTGIRLNVQGWNQ